MSEILLWGPVLFAARWFTLLLIIALAIVLVAGFGYLMAGRIPFKKLSGWGWEVEFDQVQDEQIGLLEQRVHDLEAKLEAAVASHEATMGIVERLEERNVRRTAQGEGAAGDGSPEPDEDPAAARAASDAGASEA